MFQGVTWQQQTDRQISRISVPPSLAQHRLAHFNRQQMAWAAKNVNSDIPLQDLGRFYRHLQQAERCAGREIERGPPGHGGQQP